MGKTNFDRITASPEALASFLASLPCLDAQVWAAPGEKAAPMPTLYK